MVGDTFRILAICTGNVHRSPLAGALLERWAGWYLPDELSASVSVASAGTAAALGRGATARVSAISAALGADVSAHRATQITDEMIASADLVLAASRAHRDDALGRVPSALRRTFTIREAGRIAEQIPLRTAPRSLQELRLLVAEMADSRPASGASGNDDVIDPQGLDDAAYLRMSREEVPPLASLAVLLFGMPTADLAAYRSAAGDPALLGGRSD